VILEVRDLKVNYGAIQALCGITLSLEQGEIVTLIGANGAGKSTTLRTIMGLVPPVSGEVRYKGASLAATPTHEIVRTGMTLVPEGRAIFANLSVRENLQMCARPGPDGRNDWTYERVLDAFPRLKERLDTGGQLLSGGEQQMLTIGRALLTNPRVLILDEATEGLAPRIVEHIWRVIAEVRASGIATIVVDRNCRTVLRHTDRAVVLQKGRVALAGASAEIAREEDALHALLGV
jgi:branched-chain amino acid transport system ATP-binding protein